ncbi:SDR family oxidoreductase [Sphingomonas sp. MG17]|uniref:SDR family oxidoreductase n=1 Tax=Sphingomonas tagetis TaxID=2949092 RepID=A0A9X2KL20_9SPHN|nr:SDR family NAD(P)-dependent oxidoreductase [Sphingomonas tagetis]MCP3730315.1 SDR family oxidoreductase [Sphingomonas tagetis]
MALSKTAVIFGAGPGIGIAAAREFAALRYKLALVARTGSKLARLVADLEASGATAKGFLADGADGASIDAAVADIRAWAGGDPSVVLFNAFTSQPVGPTHQVDPAGFTPNLLVNAAAAQHLVYRMAPALIAAGTGSLLFTGNGMALTPMGQVFGTLSAGKSAMRSIALTLAEDLAGTGVKVGLLTVNGPTGRGTDFDPDIIAAEFVKLHDGSVTDTEIVYNGASAHR